MLGAKAREDQVGHPDKTLKFPMSFSGIVVRRASVPAITKRVTGEKGPSGPRRHEWEKLFRTINTGLSIGSHPSSSSHYPSQLTQLSSRLFTSEEPEHGISTARCLEVPRHKRRLARK